MFFTVKFHVKWLEKYCTTVLLRAEKTGLRLELTKMITLKHGIFQTASRLERFLFFKWFTKPIIITHLHNSYCHLGCLQIGCLLVVHPVWSRPRGLYQGRQHWVSKAQSPHIFSYDVYENKVGTVKSQELKWKRFKKIAWIRSHHLQLQWKFKLWTGGKVYLR